MSSRRFRFSVRCFYVAVALTAFATSFGQAEEPPRHSAVTPAPRPGDWMKLHESFNERAKQGDVELVFLGDSITQGWADNDTWKKYYVRRHAANFGIGGDRTQHVLWRIEHGNFDGIKPKLVVLMIGTNNSNGSDNTAEEIADGIKAIVGQLREKLPDTKVLLLAIFPRGEQPNPQREKNAKASELASKLADGKHVFYLDIGPKFLAADGSLSADIMPDHLHLSSRGYEIWAEAIEPQVKKLLGENE
ncbi:MAG: GDSL family lipase [Pirellulales bacterium]|nr:GDSL family lipase [Pirellulales bacterium]